MVDVRNLIEAFLLGSWGPSKCLATVESVDL